MKTPLVKISGHFTLFQIGVRDLFEAELRAIRIFPFIAQAAQSPVLRQVVERYLCRGGPRVQRLEIILEALDQPCVPGAEIPLGELVRQAKRIATTGVPSLRRDVTLLAVMQAIVQAKLDAARTTYVQATQLAYEDAADILRESIEEETRMNRELAAIVEQVVAPVLVAM